MGVCANNLLVLQKVCRNKQFSGFQPIGGKCICTPGIVWCSPVYQPLIPFVLLDVTTTSCCL